MQAARCLAEHLYVELKGLLLLGAASLVQDDFRDEVDLLVHTQAVAVDLVCRKNFELRRPWQRSSIVLFCLVFCSVPYPEPDPENSFFGLKDPDLDPYYLNGYFHQQTKNLAKP